MINYRINNYFTTHQIKLAELQPIHIQDFCTSMLNNNLSRNTVIHYHAVIRKYKDLKCNNLLVVFIMKVN